MQRLTAAMTLTLAMLATSGCHKDQVHKDEAEAPPSTPQVVSAGTDDTVQVKDPSHFPLVAARQQTAYDTLNVTGSVQPDVSREVPVLS
ncbi:MAG TPA: efflux RND transporter periplasmic adaptor subunit, partial [Terriglobus sp.]